MRVLVFTDLHENKKAFSIAKKKAKDVDVVFFCGDITFFENDLKGTMKWMASLKKETYFLHGNHEIQSHVRDICKQYKHIRFAHKRVFHKGKIAIFGYGGGGFQYKDEALLKWFKENKSKKKEVNVLLTHQPPYGTPLDVVYERHVGSKTIKKILPHFQYAFSGHIHESEGIQAMVRKTLIANPGPEGMVFDL